MITEFAGNSINIAVVSKDIAVYDALWSGNWELFDKEKKVYLSGDVENLKDRLMVKISSKQCRTLEPKTYRLAIYLKNEALEFDRLVVLESVKLKEVI